MKDKLEIKKVDRAREAEVVFTNKVVLGRAEFAQLPKLRYIGVLATGYNVVDVAAARERGIVVTNIPAYGTRSVAQMTFSLILELAQNGGLYGIAGKGQCKNGEILFTAAHWKAVNPNNVIREINKKSTGGAK
jgi:lactate dehydrogenase-like 2-hydroxyacid dehydrogenase